MESRKGWRNRDSSAGEGVLALLEALRDGLGAQSLGLFDDDRGDPNPESLRGSLNFWDAFEQRPCGAIDWDRWYLELKKNGRVETDCGCGGGHHLSGYLIHGRWALLLVAPVALPSGGATVIASCLKALAAKLPPGKTAHEREAANQYDPRPEASAGASGGPVWWVRKRPE